MTSDLETNNFGQDVPPLITSVMEITDVIERPFNRDIPYYQDVLPDGRRTIVTGDVEGCKKFNHRQGDNPYDYKETCGLVSCEGVLRQFGVNVTEADVVKYAATRGLCSPGGGTTEYTQAQIISDFGVPARPEKLGSFERLAQCVGEGRGIIIAVNAGVLWNDGNYFDNGQANHAIVVTGVARDPVTDQIQGFFINDSGTGPQDSGRFIDVNTMQNAWLNTGGIGVVTEIVRSRV